MSKIRFSLVGIDTWFIRDRDLGRVWDWDWDLGSEISEKSPEISENIARDRDFPYIISEKLPRFGRGWYFSCIAAWISTRWLYFYRENSGKNGRDLGFRGHDVIYSGPRWTCLVVLPNCVANHALFWSNFMSRITLFWWHISTLKKMRCDTK